MRTPQSSVVLFALCAGATICVWAQQAATKPDCAAAEHRSMDYLLGEWEVVETDSGKHFARNQVERIHGGCGVRESLRMRGGSLGTATTFFSPAEKQWHTFYHDSVGFYAHLTGLTDAQGRQELIADVRFPAQGSRVQKARQVMFRDERGRPRQLGYLLNEGDLAWRLIYDLTFCAEGTARGDSAPPCGQ